MPVWGSQEVAGEQGWDRKSSGSLSVPMETQHPSSASLYQQHTWSQHAETDEAGGTGAQLRQEEIKNVICQAAGFSTTAP